MIIFDIKKFFELDLNNLENCLKITQNIDHVIHLADVVAESIMCSKMNFHCFRKI